MKKSLLMSAMLLTVVARATPHFAITDPSEITIQQEEKVKIEPDALPEPVR